MAGMAYTTSSYSTSSDYTWTTWNYTYSTPITSTASTVWTSWNSSTAGTDTTWGNWVYVQPYDYQQMNNAWGGSAKVVELTPEQKAEQARIAEEQRVAREARIAERKRLADIEAKKKEEAKKKAYELLASLLNEEQIKDLEKTGSFGFVADSGKIYRISEGWSHNITVTDGKVKRTLCCHPKKAVPVHDNMTAQLLLLKYQEAEFVRMANKGYEQRLD